jgi:hypothetical protein
MWGLGFGMGSSAPGECPGQREKWGEALKRGVTSFYNWDLDCFQKTMCVRSMVPGMARPYRKVVEH